jgi:hypothetical protein
MLTPGISSPVELTTRPAIAPVVIPCANREEIPVHRNTSTIMTHNMVLLNFMRTSCGLVVMDEE